jgi:Protein of unknown function (DUF2946)
MMVGRSIRRFAAFAAVFAVTLQALWPLLSHARPKDLSLLAPLCTVDGITHYLEVKAGKPTPLDERSAQHGEHCKLCVFGGDRDAAVQPWIESAFVSPVTNSVVSSFAVTFSRSAYLLPAHPRAPPQLS